MYFFLFFCVVIVLFSVFFSTVIGELKIIENNKQRNGSKMTNKNYKLNRAMYPMHMLVRCV